MEGKLLNIPGKPSSWVAGAIAAPFLLLVLPGDAGWLLTLVFVPAAMCAAVITAYEEAARLAAEAPVEPAEASVEPADSPE